MATIGIPRKCFTIRDIDHRDDCDCGGNCPSCLGINEDGRQER